MSEIQTLKDSEIFQLKKFLLFVPCESEEALRGWVKIFLNLELPNCTVDPTINSNPSALLWEVYSRMRAGDPDFSRCLYYASRDGGKTLISSIIELLAVLHLKRDVAHMAAIESQSNVCQRYIAGYLNNPFLSPFITQAAARRIEFTRYIKDEEVLSPAEWKVLTPSVAATYTTQTNFIQVVIATMQGANSLHAHLLVLDELDLAKKAPVEEAKMIPTQCPDGKPPVTLFTSTRKFPFGLVQQEMDKADETGLHIRHWNLLDVTCACPPSRYLPNLPKITQYVNHDTLKSISAPTFAEINDPQEKSKYERLEAHNGCVSKCRLFPSCLGKLINQKATFTGTGRQFLKNIIHVENVIRGSEVDMVKAQILCLKPSTAGLIYPRFDPKIHLLYANEIAKIITGRDYPPSLTKAALIKMMKELRFSTAAGLDHGFTHDFAVVTGMHTKHRLFVVDVLSAHELELMEKIQEMGHRFKTLNLDPIIFPDPEDPSSNKTLCKYFHIRQWKKNPGSVLEGINSLRTLISPADNAPPNIYFLRGDAGCELLAKDITTYHWKLDADEKALSIPDDDNDDRLDALRYLVLNKFKVNNQMSTEERTETVVVSKNYENQPYTVENVIPKAIQAALSNGDRDQFSSSEEPRGGTVTSNGLTISF
jgi:hypothetical protein